MKTIALSILALLSVVWGQGRQPNPDFEIGGGANLFMPRQEYESGWGIGLDGVWNFSRRYGINLAYSSAKIQNRTFTSLVGSAEISFRRGQYVHGFTSVGLGSVSTEENTIFIFGIGIKIPVRKQILIRLELRDYFTEIGIPYFTFPGGRAVIQGTGTSQYLELGLSLAYSLRKEKKLRK